MSQQYPHQRRLRRLAPLSTALVLVLLGSRGTPAVATVPQQGENVYPKVEPAKKFASSKIYQPNGSPIRLPKYDWDGARKRLAASPALQKWVASQRAITDDWMAKRKGGVEWISGWYHDFVSPEDGSHLTFTPDELGENSLSSPSDHSTSTPITTCGCPSSRNVRKRTSCGRALMRPSIS